MILVQFFATKTKELRRIRDASFVDRQSAKTDATFGSHGHSAEGEKRETVVRMWIGNPVHHVWMDAEVICSQYSSVFRKCLFNDSKCVVMPKC